MKAAIYLRTNTTQTVESQKATLLALAHKHHYKIVRFYCDIGPGNEAAKRPELNRLRRDAKRGLFVTVLVYSLDRLSRTNFAVADFFRDQGVRVVTLSNRMGQRKPSSKP
jgi:DNA invertase Pin-like site-specific DNA recombinase